MAEQIPNKTLAIRNARDFLHKLMWESKRLDALVNDGNEEFVYSFINAALTAWHMIDWAYHDLGEAGRRRFPSPNDFRDYVLQVCGWMALCREIANGSKHAKLRFFDPVIGTRQIAVDVGFSVAPDGWKPWYVDDGRILHDPKQVIRSCMFFWIQMISTDLPIWGADYSESADC